mgnify:CR=1 FL=1
MKYGLLFHYWMKDAGKCNYLEVAKKIKAAGSFCLSKRFIIRMAATRRMPSCT